MSRRRSNNSCNYHTVALNILITSNKYKHRENDDDDHHNNYITNNANANAATASTTTDGKIDSNRFESIRQAASIRIHSHRRIVMKNFDSVPQLQRFSYVHHCAARSRHGSHSR